jgi:hypothetical protein
MAPKSKPTSDRPNCNGPAKGKQHADPLSHPDKGDQAGLSAGVSGSSPHALTVPKKTKAQLREDVEDVFMADFILDNLYKIDLRGPDPWADLVMCFLQLPPLVTSARPGLSASDIAPFRHQLCLLAQALSNPQRAKTTHLAHHHGDPSVVAIHLHPLSNSLVTLNPDCVECAPRPLSTIIVFGYQSCRCDRFDTIGAKGRADR